MTSGTFERDLVQRLRAETDLAGLVSQYVSLKKSGQNLTGLCPFHSEKTPSFVVSPSKQIFHCFGCHAGGDVFSFLMKMEGTTFPETVRGLADRLGIRIPPPSRRRDKPEEDRSWIFKIHDQAAEYYHQFLMKNPAAKTARDYLAKRGIRPETAAAFRLGYAPSAWESLQAGLAQSGWSSEQFEQAGLVIARDEKRAGSRGHYDRFRDRILFPITDLQARVCGFGGRVLDPQGTPKYLNSPESPVFTKGRLLYALDRAREAVHREDHLIIVEGYMDVIAAHQAGILNVVATLGTALTESHLQLIKRFTRNLKLIFDSDEAGIRAALRSVELIAPTGLSAEVVQLPEGQDPDSFLRQQGAEEFQKALGTGKRIMDFALDHALSDPGALTIDGKLRAVQFLMPLIQKLPHPVERGHYVKKLAEGLNVREEDLREALNARPARARNSAPTPPAAPRERIPKEEEILIHLILHNQMAVGELVKQIQPDDLSDPRSRQIMRTLLECYESAGTLQLNDILHHEAFHPNLAGFLTSLWVNEPDYEDGQQTKADCIRTIKIKKLQAGLKDLEVRIGSAEREGRPEDVRNLQTQLLALKKKTLEVSGHISVRNTG